MAGKASEPNKTTPRRRRTDASANLPPVMARSSSYSHARPVSNRTSKVKRRYDVSLSHARGVEMRLPSLPQFNPGWRLLSLAIAAVLGLAGYYAWNAPTFRVDQLRISGLERLNSAQVAGVLDVLGEPVFMIDPGALEEKLVKSFPELTSASIQTGMPDQVIVDAAERTPVLTWVQGEKTWLVDAEGYAFPLREGSPAGPQLVVNASDPPPSTKLVTYQEETEEPEGDKLGLAATPTPAAGEADQAGAWQMMAPEMVTSILEISRQAPAGTPILYSARHGLGWLDPRGWEVYLGSAEAMPEKLSVYKTMVSALSGMETPPVVISVEHVHAPYYRLQK